MFAVQERLYLSHNYLAMSNHSLADSGQLQQEAFVLITMLGVTMCALLSIWCTLQSSYRYASKGAKEPPQISRRIYSSICLALVIQFWISVNMLPAGGVVNSKYPSAPKQLQGSFGQNVSSGVYMTRNLTTMGSFRHQVVPRAQKRHRNSHEGL
jgi:ABC-type Fe3+ transport system permease subunit